MKTYLKTRFFGVASARSAPGASRPVAPPLGGAGNPINVIVSLKGAAILVGVWGCRKINIPKTVIIHVPIFV